MRKFTIEQVNSLVTEFLKWLAQDHDHKYNTEKDAWDDWFDTNYVKSGTDNNPSPNTFDIPQKFQIGDKAIVAEPTKRDNFLKHALKIGEEVTIAGRYFGWRNEKAYYVMTKEGRLTTEILLEEELMLKAPKK